MNKLLTTYSCTFWILPALLALHPIEGARILAIFPIASKSHFAVDEAILRSLDAAGHNITLIMSFPKEAAKGNYTVVNISKKPFLFVGQTKVDFFSDKNIYQSYNFTGSVEKPRCKQVLELPEVQDIIDGKEQPYDVVFIEILIMYDCFLHLAGKLKIPVIGTITFRSWFFADQLIGNTFNPSAIPFELSASWNVNSFYDRVHNTWNTLIAKYFWYSEVITHEASFLRENVYLLGEDYTADMKATPSLLFCNSHASVLPRPMNPNVIEIGGIHMESVKPLPKDIERFIDEADHGVILFSLGSFLKADTMQPTHIRAFAEAFARIPQRVIWKFESEIENISSNVMLRDWIPQRDILAHKNVNAFISHCGQGGIYEAIDSATPIVTIPLFYDQRSNAAILENLNVALRLDLESVSGERVLIALNAIINDTKYYQNMQLLSASFKDRPMTPQQSVVYWTEYVIRHNGAVRLRPSASELYLFQYLLLDVVIFFLFTVISLAYVISRIIKAYCCSKASKCIKHSEQNKKKLM